MQPLGVEVALQMVCDPKLLRQEPDIFSQARLSSAHSLAVMQTISNMHQFGTIFLALVLPGGMLSRSEPREQLVHVLNILLSVNLHACNGITAQLEGPSPQNAEYLPQAPISPGFSQHQSSYISCSQDSPSGRQCKAVCCIHKLVQPCHASSFTPLPEHRLAASSSTPQIWLLSPCVMRAWRSAARSRSVCTRACLNGVGLTPNPDSNIQASLSQSMQALVPLRIACAQG